MLAGRPPPAGSHHGRDWRAWQGNWVRLVVPNLTCYGVRWTAGRGGPWGRGADWAWEEEAGFGPVL